MNKELSIRDVLDFLVLKNFISKEVSDVFVEHMDPVLVYSYGLTTLFEDICKTAGYRVELIDENVFLPDVRVPQVTLIRDMSFQYEVIKKATTLVSANTFVEQVKE